MISRHTSNVPKEDVFPTLLYCDSMCSQTCHRPSQACRRCSQVLPGAPKVHSAAPRCSQTYHNHFHGTPVPVIRDPSHFCTGYQRFQFLWRPARMPSYGLILTWNWGIQVYTPHPLRHSWRLPETKINFADLKWWKGRITNQNAWENMGGDVECDWR